MNYDAQILKAIKGLAHEVKQGSLKIERACLQGHARLATKTDLECVKTTIMSQLTDYAQEVTDAFEKVSEANDQSAAALELVQKSTAGVAADVKGLKDQIEKLQASQGDLSPEGVAILNDLKAKTLALTARTKANAEALQVAATAIAAVDDLTENAPEAPPETGVPGAPEPS